MKKILKNILCFTLFILLLSNIAFGNEPIRVYVDNELLKLENNPLSVDGNTLVPVRAIFEKLGATVEWDEDTQTVTGIKDDKIIELIINDNNARINSDLITLNTPAQIINGSAYVPARFVAESLGAKVDWDNETKSVLINSSTSSQTEKLIPTNTLNVEAGEYATINLNLTPNTQYSINVYYSSGASTAKGLETKTSDDNGNISWAWKVGTNTKSGEYRVVIKGDQEINLSLIVK